MIVSANLLTAIGLIAVSSSAQFEGIFTSPDPKYKPYHRVREQINTQAADILIAYDDDRVGRSKSTFVYIAENAIANGMRVLVFMLFGKFRLFVENHADCEIEGSR